MKSAKFTLEAFGDEVFEGYTNGDLWNGWACPFFSFEQAQKVMNASNETGVPAHYDDCADAFIFVDPSDPSDDSAFDTFGANDADGLKVYAIGSHSWMWWDENWE